MMVARPNMIKIQNARNFSKINEKKKKNHVQSVKIQTELLKYFLEKLKHLAKCLFLKQKGSVGINETKYSKMDQIKFHFRFHKFNALSIVRNCLRPESRSLS